MVPWHSTRERTGEPHVHHGTGIKCVILGSRSTEAFGIALGRLVACSAKIVADTQTHTHIRRPTVTLAAHARRGLMKVCKTLGELRMRDSLPLIVGLGY